MKREKRKKRGGIRVGKEKEQKRISFLFYFKKLFLS
jgi:hypothetical protein